MVGENLIWIRRDKLGSQLTVGILDDVLNMVEMTVTQQPEGYQWLGFPSGVDIPGEGSIELLDDVYHGPPAKISDELENKTKDYEYQLWKYHLGATNRSPSEFNQNWNLTALRDRLKQMPIKGIEITIIDHKAWQLGRGRKQADIFCKYPKDWSKEKIRTKTVKAVNHSAINKPAITGLSKAESYDEDVDSSWLENNLGVSANQIKVIGSVGLGLYALNTISKIRE